MTRKTGDRVEPTARGHVLDLHDIEAVTRALIRLARQDVAHETRVLDGTCRADALATCDRGGHTCSCGNPIWDCGREYLANLQAALTGEGYVPGWHAKTCQDCGARQTITLDGLCYDCYGLAHAAEISDAAQA